MENSLSQLDGLEETDILDAFGETKQENPETVDEISIEDIEIETIEDEEVVIPNIETEDIVSTAQEEKIVMQEQTYNSSDLANLLSQLLNNKTIEITIKIKD